MTEQKKKPPMKNGKKRYPKTESGSRIIGYYSVDGERNFLPNSSQLLYFNPPKVQDVDLDLDEGIAFAVRRKESFEEEGIDLLLEWVRLNRKKLKANPAHGRLLQPKFICTRGTLTRLLKTRSAPNDLWIIYATKLEGTIYLCADKTAKGEFAKTDENDRYSSWGYKFEQCVLSDSPNKAPDTSVPVLEAAEFRCVYQRRIGNHPILFSAVMKGVCSDKMLKDPLPLDKLTFVETKTNKIIEHVGHEKSLRKHKFLNWWSQCYLTETPAVLCGFRDRSGIVQKLKLYEVPELVKMGEPYWNPTDCIEFCQSFLTKIADTMAKEGNLTICKFENIPNHGIEITKVSSESQCGFIPESFVEALLG